MVNSHHLCVLIAEIVGGDRLIARIGEAETTRAMERCLNRVDLTIGGNGGEIVARDRSSVIATFEQCDDGVMAACEAIDRVRKLPPVSGIHMLLRVGIHYGEAENAMGEGVEGARQILKIPDINQSLASIPVVDRLNQPVRHFINKEAFRDNSLDALPWPVFTIGTQSVNPVSLETSQPLRLRQDPSPSLASSNPPLEPFPSLVSSNPPLESFPPLSSLDSPPELSSVLSTLKPPFTASLPATKPATGHCMRLKYQQATLLIDENRPVVLIGRELGNDIVVIDPRASRQHARIERRRESFVLVDESTNGCFVVIEGEEEQCLKGTERPLIGAGRFGCGFSAQESGNGLVFFEFV